MARDSRIGWTDSTWNPWRGCDKVSPGCAHCYMFSEQLRYGRDPATVTRCSDRVFNSPLRWARSPRPPRFIFTCSWSDFFHEAADEWRPEAWEIIRQTPELTYQVLTKRPERIGEHLPEDWGEGYPNVWLGVSIENRRYVDRADVLREIPAAVRFISAEPLLGPLIFDAGQATWSDDFDGPELDLTGIDWLIVGGESGPGHRRMEPAWVSALQVTSRDGNDGEPVAFFFKQWGGHPDKREGPKALLHGRTWTEMPEVGAGERPETTRLCATRRPEERSMTKTAKPITVPIAKIGVGDHNPREISTTSEAFKELVASIRQHGVLQPVLLGERTNGSWPLIAGERRKLAAAKAGLKEIPALEASHLKGAELAAAITENVIREDLTPVEEAEAIARLQKEEGLTQPQVAKRLGKSERWVRDRLVLIRLPDAVKPAFAGGEIPLEAARKIEAVAKQDQRVAEAIVAEAIDEKSEFEPSTLSSDHGVAELIDEVVVGRPYAKRGGQLSGSVLSLSRQRRYTPEQLPVPSKVKKELRKALDEIGQLRDHYGYPVSPHLEFGEKADVDAARSYGCLLEHSYNSHGKRVAYYATDPDWIADRAWQAIEKLRKQKAKEEKAAEQKQLHKKPAGDLTDAQRKERDQLEAAKRAEREREQQAREDAYSANIELGHNLYKALSKPKITTDITRLLALIVLRDHPGRISRRGLAYVREDLHEVVDNKDGSIRKVVPEDSRSALFEALEKAKTPESVVGVLLQTLIAAHYALEDEITIQSDRSSWGLHEWIGYAARQDDDPRGEIQELLERIADGAGVVPEHLAKAGE